VDFAARRHLFVLLVAAARSSYADDYVFVDSFESSDCSQPLSCAAISGTCISGQITDAAAAAPLRARFNVGLGCGSGAIGGPCDLSLLAFDAAQFAANPHLSIPLAGELTLDSCGRYRFANLSPPPSAYVAIVADGNNSAEYMRAATSHAVAANQHVDGVVAVAARLDDVNAWGSTAGQDYVSSGVLLLAFSAGGTPAAGVTVFGSGFIRYFADTDSQRYFVSAAATSTGVDGSALLVGDASAASGGESGGCAWPLLNRSSIDGVVAYAEFICQ